jgi:hypothetical protein
MRKRRRCTTLLTTTLLTVAPLAATLASPAPAHARERPEYEASRAAYRERKAATDARRAAERQAREEARAAEEEEVVAVPVAAPAAAAAPDLYPTDEQLAALRWCESSDDYTANTGNGYYGAYQFSPTTWWWLGYWGWPHEAEPAVQDQAVRDLYAIYGWSPWPGCAAWLGWL